MNLERHFMYINKYLENPSVRVCNYCLFIFYLFIEYQKIYTTFQVHHTITVKSLSLTLIIGDNNIKLNYTYYLFNYLFYYLY